MNLFSGFTVACPECRTPGAATATILGGLYTEPVKFAWAHGSFTDPPRLVAWQMSCGHTVKGDEFELFIDLKEDGMLAEFRRRAGAVVTDG